MLLSDIFDDFNADALERSPGLKGRLLIVEMNQYRIYGRENIDFEKTGLTPDTALDFLDKHPVTHIMRQNKNAPSQIVYAHDGRLCLIFSGTGVARHEWDNISEKTRKNILFVLYHELAHALVKDASGFGGTPEKTLAESIADAYALICHYQIFGIDSNILDLRHNPIARAQDHLIRRESACYASAFVLDEIVKRRHQIDFQRLDPRQAALLARRFATEYTPPLPVVLDLERAFLPLRKALEESPPGSHDWIKVLAEIVLHPKSDYYTFKIGSPWLKQCLEDRALPSGVLINLPEEYLDNACKRLKEKEFKLAQEDILFNMPLVTPASRTAATPSVSNLARPC